MQEDHSEMPSKFFEKICFKILYTAKMLIKNDGKIYIFQACKHLENKPFVHFFLEN